LLPTKDQSLLNRRNTLFLLNFLLDLRDLYCISCRIPSSSPVEEATYPVIRLDVQLDLLSGQGTDLDKHFVVFVVRSRAKRELIVMKYWWIR
jgi:hypothetical protein